MTQSQTIAQSFIVNNKQVDQFGYRALLIKNTNNSKAEFGFTTYLQRFTMYEDMFSKFMYVEGQLYDGTSFIQRVGVQAGDIIRITLFKSADDELNQTVTNDFYIESINTGAKLTGGKGSTYTFRAVSKVGWVGLKSKIKRSVTGKVSDIVYKVCEQFFKLETEKLNPANFEETYGDINLSATSIPPFEFIERLNSQAVSAANKAGDNNFFFYETRNGVVYKSLRKIVSEANVFEYNIRIDKNRDKESEEKDYQRIQEYQVKTVNDQRAKLEQGVLQNQTFTFDFISRKIEKKSFNLKDTYRDILLMGEHLAFDMDEIDNLVGEQTTVTDDQQHIFPRCSSKSFDQQEDLVSLKHSPSNAQYALMNQTVISCRVLGNPKIKPGDVINIKAAQPNASDTEEADILLSGKFLVGSVKHVVLDAATYDTIIDLFKDGYEVDVSSYRKDTNSNLIQPKQ